jgi:hypothetical protein
VKRRLDDQKILFTGCTKYERPVSDKETAPATSEIRHDEMYFVYHGKDERDPHTFIMTDQYYVNGLVKSWSIKELDLVHAERDDELIVSTKFR